MEKTDVARDRMPKAGPADIGGCVETVGAIMLSGRESKFNKIAVGMISIRLIQQGTVFWPTVEKVITDGDDDLIGELPRFGEALANKTIVVGAVVKDSGKGSHAPIGYALMEIQSNLWIDLEKKNFVA